MAVEAAGMETTTVETTTGTRASNMSLRKALLGPLRCYFLLLVLASTVSGEKSTTSKEMEIEQAVNLLESLGVRLCRAFDNENAQSLGIDSSSGSSGSGSIPLLPLCDSDGDEHHETNTTTSFLTNTYNSYVYSYLTTPRMLQESDEELLTDDLDIDIDLDIDEGEYSWIWNLLAAAICVCIAALAAGLTLGMLGMDPLMLLIKERAAESPVEREQARTLLPIIQQHHRLLVTLLLMNAVANEALPIFLEALVPPSVAVLVSVTLVLFFGEIIPSAIFTGPDQLQIASKLGPVVKMAMFLLYPVAGPIAKLLDVVLHGGGDGQEELNAYNRGELSALIRIQYEDRLANKQKRKLLLLQAQAVTAGQPLFADSDHVGALDFTNPNKRSLQQQSLRANLHQLEHDEAAMLPAERLSASSTKSERENYERHDLERSDSIHIDEVSMVEGALQMKTKVALDVYTSIRRAFCVPSDMIMTERNLVKVYASGFSRIPVYQHDNDDTDHDKDDHADHVDGTPPVPYNDDKWRICGVLITKQLIVVNPMDQRCVGTLPLYCPLCVSPSSSLVDLLNEFQTGGKGMRGGHMALVCAQPHVGNKALGNGDSLPKEAGLMGIITLEDVLEALLQEQIYDEMDRYGRDADRLAMMVYRKWKRFVKRKKQGLLIEPVEVQHEPGMASVVAQAMAWFRNGSPAALEEGVSVETTALLANGSKTSATSKKK